MNTNANYIFPRRINASRTTFRFGYSTTDVRQFLLILLHRHEVERSVSTSDEEVNVMGNGSNVGNVDAVGDNVAKSV